MIALMIDVEKNFDVPKELRGMLVAAACSESGYNPVARGDFRDRRRRGKIRNVAMAIGILQQWPWYEKYYDMDRTDPLQAAVAWIQHVRKQLPKVRKRCKIPKNNVKRLWIAAWVHAIRAPRDGGRCGETPLHYKILRKWHKQISRDHRKGIKYFEDLEDSWHPSYRLGSDEDGWHPYGCGC